MIFISPSPNQAFNDVVSVEWEEGPSLDGQNITLAYAFAGKLAALTQKPIPVSDKVWEWSTSELPNGNYQLYALLGTNISLSSVPLTIDHALAKSPQILPLDPLYLDPELSSFQVINPLLADPLPKDQVKWEIIENTLVDVAEVLVEGNEIVVVKKIRNSIRYLNHQSKQTNRKEPALSKERGKVPAHSKNGAQQLSFRPHQFSFRTD